jgi:Fe(3+) dicitrate transport protein
MQTLLNRRTSTFFIHKILRSSAILVTLFVLGGASHIVNAQGKPQTFAGSVTDNSGGNIAGASVEIKSRDVQFKRVTTTNELGEFTFEKLPKDVYQITVSASDFAGLTQTVDIGTTGNFEFVLQPQGIAEYVSITSSHLAGTPEALERTAGSIEIIGQETLENARVFNFSEALRKVSGVNIRDEEGFGLRPNIGIRGTNPTRSTKILLLEDGIPLAYAPYGDNASYYHPPIERFESVEVLKGRRTNRIWSGNGRGCGQLYYAESVRRAGFFAQTDWRKPRLFQRKHRL